MVYNVPTKIFFTKGVGVHKDRLASFELALRNAGIEKFNLVYVSSIFPPGAKIISKEIEKSNVYKGLFDGWGSMCYLLSANEVEDKLKSINGFAFEPRLDINTNQLKKMNCKYILSSIIIGN